jgi:class 3 adenylate cyclase/tetratricopeptide (TPR) repeat protein
MTPEQTQLESAIAALQGQRATLGDAVVELATAPLRAKLAALLQPSGLQHRQVTVLFADVVGSTAMAQGLAAEDALAVLDSAMRRMAHIVKAHQGRVLKFTGDGVKAAFGMDGSREDDAERAVRAGLAIVAAGREQAEDVQRAHGVADFAVRVGLHTGDVALGAGIEADNTAMGAAVNIAARMEQSAPPGALRISHDTWAQVRGLFALDEQPPLRLKGIDAPMQTYLVRSALERNVASVERGLQGLSTPMVGRDMELQRLLHTVAQAHQTRHLQALTLVGDAGLGKSRLLRELTAALTAHVSAIPAGHRLLTLRSQPDGLLRPWGLLRSLLAVQCDVADTDSAEAAQRKVVSALSPWFAERGERQAQLIGQLSGLDFADSPTVKGLDPRSLRDQALAALVAYLQALSAQGGALPVLIVEDLHWADDSSLDLLQHLLAHAAELPLALVMTARPPLLARRPGWAAPDVTVLLSPLPATHSNELAQALLKRMGEVPPRLIERIVAQAEGNPYYTEELVRRLIDDGVVTPGGPLWTVQLDRLDTLRLPTTLVGLLQARLDALPAADRQAARQASVIGHVFWDDALHALDAHATQALPALQRAAFVKAHDGSDIEGTPERQFDHHLLHQVTYDTLLKAERKLGHSAAARWLTERTQGRGAEFLAMTGEHAERAGETELAVDCFEQAGTEAQRRFANAAAVAWLRRALVLLGEASPTRRFRLLALLDSIADTLGDRAAQDAVHADMAALLERHADDACQARLWHLQAMLADRRGDRAVAERYSRQACDLAERCEAAETAALSHALLVWLHIARHEFDAARLHVEPGLQWAGRIQAEPQRAETEARVLTLSGMVSIRLTLYDEACETLLGVLSRGEALGVPRIQLGALDNLAIVDSERGRWDACARWGARMLELAQTTGNQPYAVRAHWRLSLATRKQGDSAAAMQWCERMLPIARAVEDRVMETNGLRQLANLHAEQGHVAAALPLFLQAQAGFKAMNQPIAVWECAGRAAKCEIELGLHESARQRVNEALGALDGELAHLPPYLTIGVRWSSYPVLVALADSRAAALLEQLHGDVQAHVTSLAAPADRDRVIQSKPAYRDIVSAWAARSAPAAPT